MYNLDEILDGLRDKYYCSNKMPRPSISWSKEYWTATFGKYDFYNNHITISRVLNNSNLSYEALASVVYHETVHQDFGEHDRKFALRVNQFPDYKKLKKELTTFIGNYSQGLKYDEKIADFANGKKSVIYIVLPYRENFSEAFTFYNQNIYTNFDVKINEEYCTDNKKYLYIFLVDNGDRYHIVGWSSIGILYSNTQSILHERFGGLDIEYQLSSKRNDIHILFDSTCTYTIDKKSLPASIRKDKYIILDISDEGVKKDIDYINSYCEGYWDIGIDNAFIDSIPPFQNLTYSEMFKVAHQETGYRSIWCANALCKIKNNFDTIFNKADAERYNGLIDIAYDDMKLAHKLSPKNEMCIIELIKLCALVNDFSFGKELINSLSNASISETDQYLKNSLDYLKINKV